MIILLAVSILINIYLSVKNRSNKHFENELSLLKLDNKQLVREKERLELEVKAMKELKEKLSSLNQRYLALLEGSRKNKEECRKIEDENKELKLTFEALKDYPIMNGTFIICKVVQTGLRIWYDSDWEITGIENGELFRANITRRVGEDYKGMYKVLSRCNSRSEVYKLNLKDQIYYD